MFDIVIANGQIYDGMGSPPVSADLGIFGGRIVAIGSLGYEEAVQTIDARGLVVAPGFMDIHTHSDFTLLVNPLSESAIRQGITSIVTGCCGHGCAPTNDTDLIHAALLGYRSEWGIPLRAQTFGEYIKQLIEQGISVNVMPLVGHGVLRLAIMGYDPRPATRKEIQRMRTLLAQCLEEGAAGLSTGLEYSPGHYAQSSELVELCEVVADYQGVYSTHIRNRSFTFLEAVEEALAVAERYHIPVQLSHMAPRLYAPSGMFDSVLNRLNEARAEGLPVGIDTLVDLLGPAPSAGHLPIGTVDAPIGEVMRRLQTFEIRQKLEEELKTRRTDLGERIVTFAPANPEVEGLSFGRISEIWGMPLGEVLCELLAREGKNYYNVLERHIYADELDNRTLLSQPYCVPMSDGTVVAPYGVLKDFALNRSSYGWAPRFLQEYTGEGRLLTFEEGIRKMTSLPAQLLQLEKRGAIQNGFWADIAIFDRVGFKDCTTDDKPIAYPVGMKAVLVNGEVVLMEGCHTGKMTGSILRRSSS